MVLNLLDPSDQRLVPLSIRHANRQNQVSPRPPKLPRRRHHQRNPAVVLLKIFHRLNPVQGPPKHLPNILRIEKHPLWPRRDQRLRQGRLPYPKRSIDHQDHPAILAVSG
jgi:hypothetical protein